MQLKIIDGQNSFTPLNPVNFYIAANIIWLFGLLVLDWSIEQVLLIFSLEILLFLFVNFIRMWIACDNERWLNLDTITLKIWLTPTFIICCGGLAMAILSLVVDPEWFESSSLREFILNLSKNYGAIVSLILLNTTINFFITFIFNSKYKSANPFLITYKTFITLFGMGVFMGLIIAPLVHIYEDKFYWKIVASGIIILKGGVEIVSYLAFNKRWPDFEEIKSKKKTALQETPQPVEWRGP